MWKRKRCIIFQHHFRKVYALDGSNEVINKNKKLYSKIKNLKFSKFNLNDEFNNYHILSNVKKRQYMLDSFYML